LCRPFAMDAPAAAAQMETSPAENPPGMSDCQKSLAEFAAKAANKTQIIFDRGMYVGKNTSQAASVEFVRCKRTNYARSRLQKTGGKSVMFLAEHYAAG